MTPTIARAIVAPRVLSLPRQPATRYATGMPKKTKQDDPLYTIARYTTAQVAAELGITLIAVQAAIRRGTLESEAISPRIRLVSQAAIDAYRADHLGQVGKPSRKKQRMKMKKAEAHARTAAAGDEAPAGPATMEETHA